MSIKLTKLMNIVESNLKAILLLAGKKVVDEPTAPSQPIDSITDFRSKIFSFTESFPMSPGTEDPLKLTFNSNDIKYHLRLKKGLTTEGATLFRQRPDSDSHRILQFVTDLDLLDCTQLSLLITLDKRLTVKSVNSQVHRQHIFVGPVFIGVTYDKIPFEVIQNSLLDLFSHRTKSIFKHYVK